MTEKITINKQSSIRISGEKTIYFDPWDVPKKVKEAISYTLSIKPKVAVPIHYGSIVGKPGDGAAFKEAVEKENPEIKVELILKV